MDDQSNNDTGAFVLDQKPEPIELTIYRKTQAQDHMQMACTVCGNTSDDPHYDPFWCVFGVNNNSFDARDGDVIVCARCLGRDIDDLLEHRAQGLERRAEHLRGLKGRIRNPLPAYESLLP